MKKIITTLLLVLALVGYVGLTSPLAATSDTKGATGKDLNGAMIVLNVSANDESPGATNFFGEDLAHNGVRALNDRDRDKAPVFHIGDGERWSQYPPYYRSEQ